LEENDLLHAKLEEEVTRTMAVRKQLTNAKSEISVLKMSMIDYFLIWKVRDLGTQNAAQGTQIQA